MGWASGPYPMALDILDRIRKLLRLSTSDNENEARSSALAAARLLLEHKVELYLPGEVPEAAPVFHEAPQPAVKVVAPRKVKDIYGQWWLFYETGVRAPQAHCMYCALPVFLTQPCYGGDLGFLHMGCWNERQKGKQRPGPAPQGRSRVQPETERRSIDDAAVADLWAKIHPR